MKKTILIAVLVIAALGGYFISRTRLFPMHLYPFGPQYQGHLKPVNIINRNGTWLEQYRAYVGLMSDADVKRRYSSGLFLMLVPKHDIEYHLSESVVKEAVQPVVEITAKKQGVEVFGERIILRGKLNGAIFHLGFASAEHHASIIPFFQSDKADSSELIFDLLLKQ